MHRRYPAGCVLFVSMTLAVSAQGRRHQTPTGPVTFSVVEASIADMRRAMEQGRTTSRQVVQQCLDRIAKYDPILHATITVNSHALAEADQRDRERARGRIRGPLHGIPIALKDNIQTTSMRTTGGALAFVNLVPPFQATLTANLLAAGAILIAKTGMTELANWISGDMPNNYNAVSGYGMNPYDPRSDPRAATSGQAVLDPGGSSSGIGTAASLWAANVGTETSGSILSPSSQTMLVGIKPTVGRISRRGVMPITADQDTAGPMARSVADAATLLGAMEGRSRDPGDPATARCRRPPSRDYTRYLDARRLKGARIGIPRNYYYEGLSEDRRRAMDEAIAALKRLGAVVIDPADIPSVVDADQDRNLLAWGVCTGGVNAKGGDADCSVVMKYGMKRDFNRWLASLAAVAPVKTLGDLRAWNRAHEDAGAMRFGQAQLDISDEMDVDADRARYEADRKKDLWLAATHGIDEVMRANRLDALLFPGSRGAAIGARAGYPSVIVPFALASNSSPVEGLNPEPSPFGVTFTGTACSEPALIGLAHAFEQATRRRVAPPAFP